MGRNRKRKYPTLRKNEKTQDEEKISISLPEKYLSINVKSGTKMRHILEYAFKEFKNHDSVLWTSANQGIKKVISCVEIFKRKYPELHQVTKLQYIESQKSNKSQQNSESVETRQVPEIHILLSKKPVSAESKFVNSMKNTKNIPKNVTKITEETKKGKTDSKKITCKAAEEFTEMNLKTGQKRPLEESSADKPLKKRNKKSNLKL